MPARANTGPERKAMPHGSFPAELQHAVKNASDTQ